MNQRRKKQNPKPNPQSGPSELDEPAKAENEKGKLRDAQQKTKPTKAKTLSRENEMVPEKLSLFFKWAVCLYIHTV